MAPAIPPAQARMVWDDADDELTVAGSTMEVWRWTALNIG